MTTTGIFQHPVGEFPVYLDFEEDLEGFHWGQPWEEQRLRHIAVQANVVQVDANGYVHSGRHAWAKGNLTFEGGTPWAWWLMYPLTHKQRTHFIDSPVHGLQMVSPTENVLTDESGSAAYFPGEYGSFYVGNQLLGTTLLDHKVSPLDLFPVSDVDDPRVINMAVLLQSLDADADPKPGISITPEVTACFNQALDTHGFITDWADSTPRRPSRGCHHRQLLGHRSTGEGESRRCPDQPRSLPELEHVPQERVENAGDGELPRPR